MFTDFLNNAKALHTLYYVAVSSIVMDRVIEVLYASGLLMETKNDFNPILNTFLHLSVLEVGSGSILCDFFLTRVT